MSSSTILLCCLFNTLTLACLQSEKTLFVFYFAVGLLKVFRSLLQATSYHCATLVARSTTPSPWVSIVHFALVYHLCRFRTSTHCLHLEPTLCHSLTLVPKYTCLHLEQTLEFCLTPLQYLDSSYLHLKRPSIQILLSTTMPSLVPLHIFSSCHDINSTPHGSPIRWTYMALPSSVDRLLSRFPKPSTTFLGKLPTCFNVDRRIKDFFTCAVNIILILGKSRYQPHTIDINKLCSQ